MTAPLFRTTDTVLAAPFGPARLVAIDIPGGVTTPAEFAAAAEASAGLFVAPGRGLVLSGRAPVWGFAILLHLGHPSPWIATADPRLSGAVIVQSHTPGIAAGTVLRDPALDTLLGGG